MVFFHHIIRGLFLISLDWFANLSRFFPEFVDLLHDRTVLDSAGNKYDKSDGGKLFVHALFENLEVLTALGMAMIIGQLFLPIFLRLKEDFRSIAMGFVLFFVLLCISNFAIVSAQGDVDLSSPPDEYPHYNYVARSFFEFLGRVFLFPGNLFADWQLIRYPTIPWLALTLLGMGFGRRFQNNIHSSYRILLRTALLFIILFFLVRGFGGRLNFRGQQRNEPTIASGFMDFFIQTKYPPDWCYVFITLTVDFILLNLFHFQDDKPLQQLSPIFRPLLTFGRTPLFFYIVHFWLLRFVGLLLRIPDHGHPTFRIYFVPFLWVFVLITMYFLCLKYDLFKASTNPTSLWRLL